MGLPIIALCLGAIIGTTIFQNREREASGRARKAGSWYDLDQTEPESDVKTASRYTLNLPRSGLDLVKSEQGIYKGKAAEPVPAAPPQAPAEDKASSEKTFAELCRASEAKIEALAREYTARFPVIAQYGRDWMSYPDLKKLNDDYMADHDPVKFIRGAAPSKNFALMFQKYAVQPVVMSFAMDALKQTPPGAAAAAFDFVNKDKDGTTFLRKFEQNLGLPPSMLDPNAQPMDQKAIMDWVAKSNPEVAKAMSRIPPEQMPKAGGKD